MKKFLRGQPLETYVLIAAPVLCALLFAFFGGASVPYAKDAITRAAVVSFLLGGDFLIIAFFGIYAYLLVRSPFLAVARFMENKAREPLSFEGFWRGVGSWAYYSLAIGCATFVTVLVVGQFSKAPAADVAVASHQLMAYDKSLFGVYLPFWFHQTNILARIDGALIFSYRYLSVLVSLMLLVLAFTKRDLFRQFLMAFFVATMIGFPLWRAWPAVSPNEMYRANVFDGRFGEPLQSETRTTAALSPGLGKYLIYLESVYIDPTHNTHNVTSFPSMHAAWGLLILYFGTLLWWPLAVLLLPWFVLDAVGAVYVLEHYGIDVVLGIGVAGIAIILVHYLMKLEKRYYLPTWQPHYVFDIIQHDVRAAKEHLLAGARDVAAHLRRSEKPHGCDPD